MEDQEKGNAQISQADVFDGKRAFPQEIEIAEKGKVDDKGEIDGLDLYHGGKTVIIEIPGIMELAVLPDAIGHANDTRRGNYNDKGKEYPIFKLCPDIKKSYRQRKNQEEIEGVV